MSISDRCAAVAPPGGMGKDWTEAFQHGLDLNGYWRKVLDQSTGRSTYIPELDPSSSSLFDATVDSPESHSVVDDLNFDPPAHPWRDRIGKWPPDWRLHWGALANSYSHSGMSWSEAEIRAANEVTIEKEAAGGGPAPQPDTDPHAALQRDFLEEMIASGEAERFLSPAELCNARRSLVAKPLDYNEIQPFVAMVMSRSRVERDRTLGIPEAPVQGRWHCQNSFCRNKSRWWLSEHGVVNCRNCCPASPCTRVVAEGDSQDAPLVEPGRSHQIQSPFAGRPPTT